MAFTSAQLVDSDRTTVVFDLHTPDGTGNSSWGSVATKFALGSSFRLDVPHQATRFEHPGADGGFTTFHRRGLATATWRQWAGATTEANLRTGVGRLIDVVTAGGTYLKLVSGVTRFLPLEPSGYPTTYQGKELELYELYTLFAAHQGLDMSVICQPFLEGSEVTVAGVTVPNDPATSTKVRVFPVTGVTGDLPTPAKVRVTMDTGATVEKVLIAHRARGRKAATVLSDYLAETGYLNCDATGRGWTITLGTNTALTADAQASGGNMALVTFPSAPTQMLRRMRATRTTKLESLRGSWDVWGRFEPSMAAEIQAQLRWGLSATADPVAYAEPEVTLDTNNYNTGGSYYTDKRLGRITIPSEGAVAGLALEVWVAGSTVGEELSLDFLWLTPADAVGTLVVPVASTDSWLGSQLTTPPAQITGDPAWAAGSLVGTGLRLNAVNEGGGSPTNTGQVWGASHHDVSVRVDESAFVGTYKFRVVRITATQEEVIADEVPVAAPASGSVTRRMQFDGLAGVAYQVQFVLTAHTSGSITVQEITHQAIPALGLNESARTDPNRNVVDRLDASGNINGSLARTGEMPAMLEPGDNHLFVRCDEVTPGGSQEPENELARTPTVSVTYFPRYGL